jgi:hypothetical protein
MKTAAFLRARASGPHPVLAAVNPALGFGERHLGRVGTSAPTDTVTATTRISGIWRGATGMLTPAAQTYLFPGSAGLWPASGAGSRQPRAWLWRTPFGQGWNICPYRYGDGHDEDKRDLAWRDRNAHASGTNVPFSWERGPLARIRCWQPSTPRLALENAIWAGLEHLPLPIR